MPLPYLIPNPPFSPHLFPIYDSLPYIPHLPFMPYPTNYSNLNPHPPFMMFSPHQK